MKIVVGPLVLFYFFVLEPYSVAIVDSVAAVDFLGLVDYYPVFLF